MKKVTIHSFIAASILFFGFSASAQTTGEIKVGAGLVLGTASAIGESGSKAGIGINFGGEYLITDIISVAPSYTVFFGSDYEFVEPISGTSTSASFSSGVFNLDGRYYFGQDELQLYGLFGLAFFSSKTESSVDSGFFGTLTSEVKGSQTGVNIGGGLFYPLNNGLLFNGQIKYQSPGNGQLVIRAGLAYVIN